MSIQINENVTLHYIPMPKLKTSAMGIYIHRPLTSDEAAKNGLIPFVLKRGTLKYQNTEEISKKLDDLYGATLRAGVIKKGLDHIISFTAETISEKYAPYKEPLFLELTELMLSVLLEPVTKDGAFLPEYVEQEKKNNIENVENIINDKRSYAALRCCQEMFSGTDLAVSKYGTVEEIKAVNPKDLYEHYKNVLTSSPIDIILSGEWEAEKIADMIKEAFSKLQLKCGEIKKTKAFVSDREVRNFEESMEVAQGKLSMGFVTGIDSTSEEYWSMMVANSIFGGGAHSKLFNNVREKLSLCYYASSGMGRYDGAIVVNAGIECENFKKAYDEILVQLDDLKAGKVSELEYVSSINAIVNSLKSCRDDQYAMQSFWLSEKVSGENRDLDYVIEKIKNVSLDMAVEASKKIKLDTVYFLKGGTEG